MFIYYHISIWAYFWNNTWNIYWMLSRNSKRDYDELKFKKDSTGVGFDKSDLIYDAIGIVSATIILVIL